MRYVIDSSVAFKWVVPEIDTDKAVRFRDDFRNGVHDLIAPDVFPLELAYALTRAERQGRLNPGQGGILLADVLTTAPHFHHSLSLLSAAYAIASRMRVGIYDCLYVALAEQEQCDFITADDHLVRALQAQYPRIVALGST